MALSDVPSAWLGVSLVGMLVASVFPSFAAALDPIIEVKDMPYQLADRLEGVYTQWSGRWVNGPMYRRMEASFKYNLGVPVFMGPFCGYVFGGEPNTWCIAQCEEEHMLKNPGLLLPCDQPAPDGTECPPAEPAPAPAAQEGAAPEADAPRSDEEPPALAPAPPPPPPPRLVLCALLGHARRWHEAGNEAGLVPPPPEYWRLNLGVTLAEWVDARGAALDTTFSFAPRTSVVAPPGERLRLRKDRTVRSGARPELCLGAERGAFSEGVRLLFWDCGLPPYPHERWLQVDDVARGGHILRFIERPEFCASLPSTEGAGAALVLGPCSGTSGRLQPAVFTEAEDGTFRVGVAQDLCLGVGSDRPELGSPLRLSRCAVPAPKPAAAVPPPSVAAPAPVAVPAAQDPTVAVLQAVQAFQTSLEARLESKIERLEREVAELRAERHRSPEPAVAVAVAGSGAGIAQDVPEGFSNESSCTAIGCRASSGPADGANPFVSF